MIKVKEKKQKEILEKIGKIIIDTALANIDADIDSLDTEDKQLGNDAEDLKDGPEELIKEGEL
jgi:hypothetical protein